MRIECILLYLINAGSIARAMSRASVTEQSIDHAKGHTGFVVTRHDDDVGCRRDISGNCGCSSVVAKLLSLEFASARKQDDPNCKPPKECGDRPGANRYRGLSFTCR
jgi:hypothetical protein